MEQRNEFDELPLVMTFEEVQMVLGCGRYTAWNIFYSESFPRLEIMKRSLVLKSSFIEWYENYMEECLHGKNDKTASEE